MATAFGRSAWLGVESPEWWRASGGRDEAVPSRSVGFVWCAGTDRMSEGGCFVPGRCATGVLVPRDREPLLTEPLLMEPWLVDPGVPAAGEVTSGAGDVAEGTAAGDGTEAADIEGDVAGTTGGA